MSTLNYYFDRRSVKADGTSPVKLSVNTRTGNFLVPTGICVSPNEWNASQRIIVKHPQRAHLNAYLSDMMVRSDNALLDEQRKCAHTLAKAQMKAVLLDVWRGTPPDDSVSSFFGRFANDRKRSPRTRELYAITWHKIRAYLGAEAAERLLFGEVTVPWLRNFEAWLTADCPSANARAIHLRNLRAVFNEAIDEEVTTHYPFRKFTIRREPTRKRALTIEQLRWLKECPKKKWQQKYVDIFFLMFYLLGINAIDLLTAKASQVVDGRLEYTRAKTGTLYSVKIEPEAQEIIERYRGKKHLLQFGDEQKNYKNWVARMNRCLASLIPGCTTYWARHSVATIAASLDIPLDTIARMLGHSDPSRKITLVYVDFDQEKVDVANRRVIDYLIPQ